MADLSPSRDTLAPEILARLTVPQLKAICKEKKLSGFSKLAKSAIIQKIIKYSESLHKDVVNVQTEAKLALSGDSSNHNHASYLGQIHASAEPRPSKDPKATLTSTQLTPSNNVIYSKKPTNVPTSTLLTVSLPWIPQDSVSSPQAPKQPVRKRVLQKDSVLEKEQTKKPRVTAVGLANLPRPIAHSIHGSHSRATSSYHVPQMYRLQRPRLLVPTANRATDPGLPINVPNAPFVVPSSSFHHGLTNLANFDNTVIVVPNHDLALVHSSAKRLFKPLVSTRNLKAVSVPMCPKPLQPGRHSPENSAITRLEYLDFPILDAMPIILRPISMPPSISQRKHVATLALAFSLIPVGDVYRLTRVSRLFRYAVYISAAERLNRRFSGERFTAVLEQYSSKTTNMWPYLRKRETEYISCQTLFCDTFLGDILACRNQISDRLWSNPDNTKQATVAVRFLLTRLFFQVSVGIEIDKVSNIVEVNQVVEGEIWSVEVNSGNRKELFFVVEATCEVIGHAPLSSSEQTNTGLSIPLRADWATYISRCTTPTGDIHPPETLIECLRWTNHEEYIRGISKLWLSKIDSEGKIGAAKRLVAERYIIACVVNNSLSGRWMSSTEMAQDFDGLTASSVSTKQGSVLRLFLPAHHHVESLHFTSLKQKPLHPALAMVQTPGRAYYIFKDNAMQVGCEEDGVSDVWMRLLNCDESGHPTIHYETS